MGKGRVKISKRYLLDALKFPYDWDIESIKFSDNGPWKNDIEVIISGSDFPEYIDGAIKDCQIIIHKENIRFEVKEDNET